MVSYLLLNMFFFGSRHCSCCRKLLMEIFHGSHKSKHAFITEQTKMCVPWGLCLKLRISFSRSQILNFDIFKDKGKNGITYLWRFKFIYNAIVSSCNKHYFDVDANEWKWPIYNFFICLNVDCLWFLVDLTTGGCVDQGEGCPHVCSIWLNPCAKWMLCVSTMFFRVAASMVFLEARVWDHVTKCFAHTLCICHCNCKRACLAQTFIYSDSISMETVFGIVLTLEHFQ